MIKKLAALGIISAIAFAPVVSYAEDAPATGTTDTAKTAPAKPAKTTKHKTHKTKKSSMKKAPMATPSATETPKS